MEAERARLPAFSPYYLGSFSRSGKLMQTCSTLLFHMAMLDLGVVQGVAFQLLLGVIKC